MHPELLLLIGISLSLGFTPGPNNAVAAYSGFNFGIRKTLPLILGVGFGYTALIMLINFVLISTFKNYPIIQEIIRVLGTIFLIYLAYKISFSKISSDGRTENPVKFLDKFHLSIYKSKRSNGWNYIEFKFCRTRGKLFESLYLGNCSL